MKIRKGKSNEKQLVDKESHKSNTRRSAGVIVDKDNARNDAGNKAPNAPEKLLQNGESSEEQKAYSESNTTLDLSKSNSSTPRRRKDPLANLYSSLSPKYIGFSTPKSGSRPENEMPMSNDKGCSTRRRKLHNSGGNELFLTTTESMGLVRRTNNSLTNSPVSCSDSEGSAKRRSFESPIEKLLRKNRSNEMNATSPSPSSVFEDSSFIKDKPKIMARKELMDIKVKVARDESLDVLHKNGINTVHLDQHDKVIHLKNIMSEEGVEEAEPRDSEDSTNPSDNLTSNAHEHEKSTTDDICPLPAETEMEAEAENVAESKSHDETEAEAEDGNEHHGINSKDHALAAEVDSSDANMNEETLESNLEDNNQEAEEETEETHNSDQDESMNESTPVNIDDDIVILDTSDDSDNSEFGSECVSQLSTENFECNENVNGTLTDCQNTESEFQSNRSKIDEENKFASNALTMPNNANPSNETEISSLETDARNMDRVEGERDEESSRNIGDEASKRNDEEESANNSNVEELSGSAELQENSNKNIGHESRGNIEMEESSSTNNIHEYNENLEVPESGVTIPSNNSDLAAVPSDEQLLEIAQTVPPTEDFENPSQDKNENQVDIEANMPINIISVNSPSSVSMDSAKGSSVNNDVSWVSFSTGDIFWGQLYSYCYWPCMVCPDPDGKTITTESGVGRSTVPHVMVHVRFFADNARRNWVKRDNLFPFTGLDNYRRKMLEYKEKYGKKSAKFKAFVVSKGKQRLWNLAIDEANLVRTTPSEKRLEKFNEIYESSKLLSKMEKKRRRSFYVHFGSTSDIGSLYDSSDNLSWKQVSQGSKRERSISPFSPAFSPVGPKTTKRRKVDDIEESTTTFNSSVNEQRNTSIENTSTTEKQLSQCSFVSTSSQQDEEIYNNNEFKIFFKAMKEFVMKQNTDEKLERSLVVAVRNIWALKHINSRQMQARALESSEENNLGSTIVGGVGTCGSFKRLSNRLRNLTHNRSLAKMNPSEETQPQPKLTIAITQDTHVEEKVKKPINRPIEEVIDDIFNLDNKYLFKGLGRDPICKYCLNPGGLLEKCSKNCQSMFHVECMGMSNKQKGNSRKSKSATNTLEEASVEKNFAAIHITADDVAHPEVPTDPEKDKSASAENLNEPESPQDNVVADLSQPKKDIVCEECSLDEEPKCIVCKRKDFNQEEIVHCNIPHCLNSFHPSCCKYWPQAKITKSKNKIESFRCPSHVCHTCVSDDPKGKFQNISSSKLTKCVKCPASFHTDSTCIPAGSQILTAAYIICPRHRISKSDQKVNVNWCFICVGGGQVVCCETCPTAVHAACLNIPINSDEGYICEECETGRMPLYGEMVWAKFNNFRWWPAIILPPTEIPNNIMRMSHGPSDFVVRFFGTHDHGWISRRRVYLYLEGDSTEPPKSRTSLDNNYTRGVEEAKRIWEIIKSKKSVQRLTHESKQKLHPQPYVKIKSNRAVPPLKLHVDMEKVSKCDCSKDSADPCGPESNCLNRVLYHECNPKLCPAGERCQNQMFESRISPKLEVVYVKERGFGLVCREPISAGTFVIEYVGEVINDDEFKQRMMQKTLDRDENFYFLSLEKDYIIDAGPKGNLARFMNHSCDPNCETQKWSVNGLNRVGLFAITDIPANTELTFNYHWDELLGSEKKICYCGAAKCAGQIGEKFKETKIKSDTKPLKSKSKIKSSKVISKAKQLKRLRKNKTSSGSVKTLIKISQKNTLKKNESAEMTLVNDSVSINTTEAVTEG